MEYMLLNVMNCHTNLPFQFKIIIQQEWGQRWPHAAVYGSNVQVAGSHNVDPRKELDYITSQGPTKNRLSVLSELTEGNNEAANKVS